MAKMEDEIIYLNTSSNESSKALVQYDPNLFLMQNNQIFGGSGYPVMDFNVFGNALVKNVRNMDMSLMQNNQFFGEIGHISKEEMDFFEQVFDQIFFKKYLGPSEHRNNLLGLRESRKNI
uniref:Uncharacterized protein n=1 Tax=Meloidogyne hapla TaxID=6305 RepID=A0A1I8BCD8_MELHA